MSISIVCEQYSAIDDVHCGTAAVVDVHILGRMQWHRSTINSSDLSCPLLFLIRNIVLSYSNDYKNPHKNWNKKKLFIYQQLSLEVYPVIQIHDLTCDWHLFRFEYSFFRVPNNQLIGEDYPWLHPGVFLLKMCDSLSVRLIFWYFFRILRIN